MKNTPNIPKEKKGKPASPPRKIPDTNNELEIAIAKVLKKNNIPENAMFGVIYAWEEDGKAESASSVGNIKLAGAEGVISSPNMTIYSELVDNLMDRAVENRNIYKKYKRMKT